MKAFVFTTWENIKTSVGGFADGFREKVFAVWGHIKQQTMSWTARCGASDKMGSGQDIGIWCSTEYLNRHFG